MGSSDVTNLDPMGYTLPSFACLGKMQPLSQKMSSKIMKEARSQQLEMEDEETGVAAGGAPLIDKSAIGAVLQKLVEDSDDEGDGFDSDTGSMWAPGELSK